MIRKTSTKTCDKQEASMTPSEQTVVMPSVGSTELVVDSLKKGKFLLK